VTLSPPADPGFQAFAGWNLRLSPEPLWNLSLGGEVTADLSGLGLSGVELGGEGSVDLGPVPRATPVAVSGLFAIRVPSAAPVRVVGEAIVPEAWEQLADGWQSPFDGEGWVITVASGSRVVVEASS
jgi:hypothetical protein